MCSLAQDLEIVKYWDEQVYQTFPITYNHLLQGGYFAMPSARAGEEGELGIGFTYFHPYHYYNLRCQLLECLEISGNYRVFHRVPDPVLSKYGFGDFSDKGANIKFLLFKPEESGYVLPGLAIGWEDFMGTSAFEASYLVLTQVFLSWNLELSLGVGWQRMKGMFGGGQWVPFRSSSFSFLQPFRVIFEYDCIPYTRKNHEPHPDAREKKSHWNVGIGYDFFHYFQLTASRIKGKEYALSVSANYNWPDTEGFLPKIKDPLSYVPQVYSQLNALQLEYGMLDQEWAEAFREQRLDLLKVEFYYNLRGEKSLRLLVVNETYWKEERFRARLHALLGAFIPCEIEEVTVVVQGEGCPIQEYVFPMEFVRRFHENKMSAYELTILTPMKNVSFCEEGTVSLFSQRMNRWNFEVTPNTHTLFGSSSGKFKYTLGVHLGWNGFLGESVYYSFLLGYTFSSNIGKLHGYDLLNPSQLIHVRSDLMHYYHRGVSLDEAYIQKNWACGEGWYAKCSAGYFETEYGGVAGEVLYDSVSFPWAIGIETAVLKKRDYRSLGFTSRIRKCKGHDLYWVPFPYGTQGFVHLYYEWKEASLSVQSSFGKFLANDWGVRNQVVRYFPSGLQLILWYTLTNGNDRVNGKRYYDKGVGFSMPFDIFYTHSERNRWCYGMSAWLRDVGVQAYTGKSLYEMIEERRQ